MTFYKDGYPAAPGWKARATARQAAEGIAPAALPLRERVFNALAKRPGTPEEVAAYLGEPVMNVRPRCSELARQGRIEDSRIRREAMGGRKAIVWRVTNG